MYHISGMLQGVPENMKHTEIFTSNKRLHESSVKEFNKAQEASN